MSAYVQLLGMFGNQEGQRTFLENIKQSKTKEISNLAQLGPYIHNCMSQFSPFVKVLEEDEIELRMSHKNCSLYQNMLQPKVIITGEVEKEYVKMNKLISQWSELHYDNLTVIQYLNFGEYLWGVNEHNLDVREYIFGSNKISGEILDIGLDYKFIEMKARSGKTLLYSKFLGSELAKDIIHAFDHALKDFQENTTSHPLFYFVSGDDDNLFSVMNLLGINYGTVIPFGGSLFIELREDDVNGKMFIRAYLDDEELDVNIIERNDIKKEDNVVHHRHPKHHQVQLLDEADEDSSYYYYLKRYLLRRVFVEDVSVYCEKSMDDLIFMEYSFKNHDHKNDNIFLIAMILSFISICTIMAILGLGICFRMNQTHKFSVKNETFTKRNLMGKHHIFVDEVDQNFKESQFYT